MTFEWESSCKNDLPDKYILFKLGDITNIPSIYVDALMTYLQAILKERVYYPNKKEIISKDYNLSEFEKLIDHACTQLKKNPLGLITILSGIDITKFNTKYANFFVEN